MHNFFKSYVGKVSVLYESLSTTVKEIISRLPLVVIGTVSAIYSALSYTLIWDGAIIYHEPFGYYIFALFPALIITFLYPVGFFVSLTLHEARPARSVSSEEIVTNVFLYSLFAFLLFNFLWGTNIIAFLLTTISLAAGLSSTYAAPESRIFAWAQAHGIFRIGFYFFALILPISILTGMRVFVPEPKTPFELRGEILSCQNNEDCANFNCTGYNMGRWYCDTNGYPKCDLEKKICGCTVGCL